MSKEEILEDKMKLIKHKTIINSPKRSLQILVLGAPGSGCSTLTQNLQKQYGFVQVSIGHMTIDHVTNNTKIGELGNFYFKLYNNSF